MADLNEITLLFAFQDASPQLTKMTDMDILMEDSLDGGPPSVGSGEIPTVVSTSGSTTTTPATTKKVKNQHIISKKINECEHGVKCVYVIFSFSWVYYFYSS